MNPGTTVIPGSSLLSQCSWTSTGLASGSPKRCQSAPARVRLAGASSYARARLSGAPAPWPRDPIGSVESRVEELLDRHRPHRRDGALNRFGIAAHKRVERAEHPSLGKFEPIEKRDSNGGSQDVIDHGHHLGHDDREALASFT